MAELKPGIWPVKPTQFKQIDPNYPHSGFLPAEPGEQEGFVTPFKHRYPSDGGSQNIHPSQTSEIWKNRGKDKYRDINPTEAPDFDRYSTPQSAIQAANKGVAGMGNPNEADASNLGAIVQKNDLAVRSKRPSGSFKEAIDIALEYDSEQDDEDSEGLDTLEHAHEHPHTETETTETYKERVKNTAIRLVEATAKQESVAEFVNMNPQGTLDDYLAWAKKNGKPPVSYVSYRVMRQNILSGMASYLTPEAQAASQRPEFDRSKATGPLADLLNLVDTATDEELRTEASVAEKFSSIWATAYNCARGKSIKRHAFICGAPGVGKTFTLKTAIEKGLAQTSDTLVKRRGSIGKAQSDILAFLYEKKDGHVIVLDDCDGFLTGADDDVINILKAAMDPDDPEVSISSTMRRMVAKKLGLLGESTRHDGVKFLQDRLYGRRFTEDEDDLAGGDEEEETPEQPESEDIEAEGEEDFGELPETFKFLSRIIFISNLRRADVPEAIIDRCKVDELVLSRTEIMERIREVLPELLKNEDKYTPEELDWAKTNVYKWLAATVQADAEGASIPTPQGAIAPDIKVSITFRLFIDLVDTWLFMSTQGYQEGLTLEALEKKMTLPFIIRVIFPALKGDARPKRR